MPAFIWAPLGAIRVVADLIRRALTIYGRASKKKLANISMRRRIIA
jgi:hypothetical protein